MTIDTSTSSSQSLRPSGRGVLHSATAIVVIPAGVLLLRHAQGATAKTAAAIYVTALFLMLATSACYHRPARSPRVRVVMQRLDHCGIYLLIAGSYAPICLLALPLAWGIPVLSVVGTGAVCGVVLTVGAFHRARVASHVLYLAMGWAIVPVIPVLITHLTGGQLALLIAGGLTYTVGFPVLIRRRPNPWPTVFGYHEIWHFCTVAAAGLHFALVAKIVR